MVIMSVLKGMLQIKNYAQRSESTIITWILNYGFPAVKMPESSIWESDTDLIDEWRKGQINGNKEEVKRPAIGRVVKRGKR